MAQWEAYSWLGVASTSPLAVCVVVWSLAVAKAFSSTQRRRWNGFDSVLALALVAQAASAILVGAWSVIRLASNDIDADRLLSAESKRKLSIVIFVIGASAALRALKLTTLASLAVDAALKIRRPSPDGSYSLLSTSSHSSRGGVVYHIVVLVIVSILVGVAACLALPSTSNNFYQGLLTIPLIDWSATNGTGPDVDTKYPILLLAVEIPLLIVVFFCLVYVQVKICSKSTSIVTPSASTPNPYTLETSKTRLGSRLQTSSDTSTASTSASRRSEANDGWDKIKRSDVLDKAKSASMTSIKSSKASTTSRRNDQAGNDSIRKPIMLTTSRDFNVDLRFSSVSTVMILWTLLDFGPHLVSTIAGLAVPEAIPRTWPLELAYAMATILSAFLMPLCLICVDPLLKDAAKYTFSTKAASFHPTLPDLKHLTLTRHTRSTVGGIETDDDVVGVDINERDDELSKKIASSPASTILSNGKQVPDYDMHGYRVFRTAASIPRKESGVMKFPLTNGSLFAASSASTLLSHPSSTFKPSGTSTFSSNKSSPGYGGAASTMTFQKPAVKHNALHRSHNQLLGPPDLNAIWVPPPPANPPPPISSRTSTVSSVCDDDSAGKGSKQSRGTSPCVGMMSDLLSNEGDRRSDVISEAVEEHLYMSLPEPSGSPSSCSSSSTSSSSVTGEDDGKCNSFTTDAKSDFVFRRPKPPPPPPPRNKPTDLSSSLPNGNKVGSSIVRSNNKRRRPAGKKTPSKRQRNPLETLDEGIPPPKDFEDSMSDKLKQGGCDSDLNDASSAGSVKDLILKVGALRKTRSRSSLIGFDNPVFQSDNSSSSDAKRDKSHARSKSGERSKRNSLDDGFQIYRFATPRTSQDSRSLLFSGNRCWQTSLSMNALDSIGLDESKPTSQRQSGSKLPGMHHGATSHVLPVRSGSAMSLYGVEGAETFSPPYMPMNSYRQYGDRVVPLAALVPPGFCKPFQQGTSTQELRKMSGSRGVVASLLKRQQQQQLQYQRQHQFSYQQQFAPALVFQPQESHRQVQMLGTPQRVPTGPFVQSDSRRVMPVIWPQQQQLCSNRAQEAAINSTSVPDVRRVIYSEYL